MSYEVQRLVPRHHLMINLALAGLGPSEIAANLGVSSVNVQAVLNCPLGQAELARRRAAIDNNTDTALTNQVVLARQVIEDSALDAALGMRGLMNDPDSSIKFRAVKDILDRATGAVGEAKVNVTVINADKMQVLLTALAEVKDDHKEEFIDAQSVA